MTKAIAICAVVLFGFVVACAAQNSKPTHSQVAFVLDANKPFVHLEFVRIERISTPEAPKVQGTLYLRVVNNCRVPINVDTDGDNDIIHAVVYEASASTNPLMPSWLDMPSGYAPDVRNQRTIAPGQRLVVKVPGDSVSSAWHIEVPFEFALRPASCCGPRMNAVFKVEGIPETNRSLFLRRKRSE